MPLHKSITNTFDVSTGNFLVKPEAPHFAQFRAQLRRDWFFGGRVIGDHKGLGALLEDKKYEWWANCDAARFFGALRVDDTINQMLPVKRASPLETLKSML